MGVFKNLTLRNQWTINHNRKPRFNLPLVAQHVLIEGLERTTMFCNDADYRTCIAEAVEASQEYDVAVHAFVLLPDDGGKKVWDIASKQGAPELEIEMNVSSSL